MAGLAQQRSGSAILYAKRQARRGLDLIAREGWTHVDTYEDAGVSGALASRPALNRLLADAAAGRIDVVIAFALDRLGRDAGHLRDLMRVLDAAGVRVVAAGQALDRQSAEGRLQTGILAEFAEFERAKIKDRTRAGIRGRAMAQRKPWGSPRYGYRKADGGGWEPDPAEVPTVQRIFTERVEHGRSYNAIATQVLNPPPAVLTRHGKRWTATTVRAVLTSRVVLGEFFHGGEWLPGTHPAIVDEDTWHAAQALAALGAKYTPRRPGRRPTLHLFTGGLLRCSECGEAMLARSDRDTYECRTNEVLLGAGAGSCAMPALPRAEVDRRAMTLFDDVFLDLDATREHVARDLDARLHEVLSQADRAAREVSEKQAQVAKVERDYLSSTLNAENFERFSARLTDEVTAAEAERLTAHAANIRHSRADLDAEGETLHRLADLRTSLLATVRTADQVEDIDALRRAMAQVFSVVYAEASLGHSERDLGLVIQVKGGRTPVPLSPRETNVSGSGVPQ